MGKAKTRVYAIRTPQGTSMCEAPTREAAGLSEAIRLGLIGSCEPASSAEVAAHFRAGREVHRVGDKPAEGPMLHVEQNQTDESRIEWPVEVTADQIAEAAERLGVTSTSGLPEQDAGHAAGTVDA